MAYQYVAAFLTENFQYFFFLESNCRLIYLKTILNLATGQDGRYHCLLLDTISKIVWRDNIIVALSVSRQVCSLVQSEFSKEYD